MTTPDPGAPATDVKPVELTAYMLAEHYLNVGELAGAEDHPQIRAWLAESGFGLHAHDETPWCGAFVAAIARLARLPVPKSPARARSWLTAGRAVMPAWAAIGWDVVVLSRGGTPAAPAPPAEVLDAPGHVGFFAGFGAGVIWLLGGNQSDRVTRAAFPMTRLLGVRRLRELARPAAPGTAW
jgi:uncharacterized protein (TIGR02594 family)